jgi:hypothetical protein
LRLTSSGRMWATKATWCGNGSALGTTITEAGPSSLTRSNACGVSKPRSRALPCAVRLAEFVAFALTK